MIKQLYYKTSDTAAQIFLPENVKIAKPGDNLKVRAKLHFPLTITKGCRFALREGGKTVAAGVVTEILPEQTVLDAGRHPKKVKETPPPATDAAKKDEKPAQTKAGDKKSAGDKKPADKKDAKSAPKPAGKQAPKEAPKSQSPPPKAATGPATTGSKVPPPPPKAPTGTKTPPPPPPKAPTGTKTPPPPPPAAKKTTPPPPPPPKKK